MQISRVISIGIITVAAYGCGGSMQRADASVALEDKVLSYWDDIDVAALPEDSLEQRIVDYIYLAGHLSRSERESIWPLFYRHMREQPNEIVVDYLGESDSPLYSPPMLEEYLTNLVKFADDETVRMRSEYLLENIRKNRPGERITDIRVLKDNKETSLHRLIAEADVECMLVFYDPDCDACNKTFDRLQRFELPDMRIIAISVAGNTKAMNKSWISALVADEEEFDRKFYYTSLPSIYIVSGDGIIKQKEITL